MPDLRPAREALRRPDPLHGRGRRREAGDPHHVVPGQQPQERLLPAGGQRRRLRRRRGQVRPVPRRGLRQPAGQGGPGLHRRPAPDVRQAGRYHRQRPHHVAAVRQERPAHGLRPGGPDPEREGRRVRHPDRQAQRHRAGPAEAHAPPTSPHRSRPRRRERPHGPDPRPAALPATIPSPRAGRLVPRAASRSGPTRCASWPASSSRSGSTPAAAGSPAAARRARSPTSRSWAVPFGIVGGRLYHVITDPAAVLRRGRPPAERAQDLGGRPRHLGRGRPRRARRLDRLPPPRRPAPALRRRGRARASPWPRRSAASATGSTRSCTAPAPTCRGAWRSTRDQAAGHAVRGADGTAVVLGYFHPTFLYESLWCLSWRGTRPGRPAVPPGPRRVFALY